MPIFLRSLLPLLLCAGTLAAGGADFHLSPAGDDLATGTSTNTPWRTLSTAVHRIRGGDTLWLAGGTYRGFTQFTNNTGRADAPITLKPLPGQTVLLKGSQVVEGWVPEADGIWRRPGWNYNSQQVFVDGELLQQLGWPNEHVRKNACNCASWLYVPPGVGCGSFNAETGGAPITWPLAQFPENAFFYDAVQGDLRIRLAAGQDPNQRLVEASNTVGILHDRSKTGHLVLEDLHFLHTSTLTITEIGWPAVILGPYSEMRRGSIEWCDGVGLYMLSNSLVEDAWIAHNGINGINNNVSTNVVIRGCSVRFNNYRKFTLGNAGGIKIIPDAGALVENCDVSDNFGNGIWFDTCGAGHPIVIRNNRVANNTTPAGANAAASGIFIEFSRNAEIYNNLVISNSIFGVEIAASSDCRIYNNVITGTSGSYALRVASQNPDNPLDNIQVFNNLLANNRSSFDLAINRENGHLVRRIRADHNLVHRSVGSVLYAWGSQNANSLAAWRTISGLDLNGLSTPPQVDAGFAPLPGSPVIDAGSPLYQPPFDAGGATAGTDGNGDGQGLPDIGAFEYFSPSTSVRYVDPANPTPAAPYTTPATAATNLAQAVAAASPGDVIELAPGIHPVHATIQLSKAVVVRGRTGAESPVLLASGATPHRLLQLNHANARVEGVVLRGGSSSVGGGAYVQAGLLLRCRLEANHADFFGGGAYLLGTGRARGCTFEDNDSSDCGGGVWMEPGTSAEDCVFSNNIAANRGGGVYLRAGSTLTDSTLWGNRANEGGGAYAEGGTLPRCHFTDNRADLHGGGAVLAGDARAEACRFAENQATSRGGGAELRSSTALLLNCLLTANQAAEGGGAWVESGAIRFCTLADNTASLSSGGLRLQASARGHSVIAYHNQAPASPDLSFQTGAALDYSCASAAAPGMGNTTLPPRFRNRAAGDYLPGWGSPCVDTGHPSDTPAQDLDAYPRVRNGDADTLARADMGAREAGLVRYVDLGSPAPANPYSDWSTAARTLHDALNIAQAGDVVLVAAGTYPLSTTVALSRAVEVRSVAGPLSTVLDGQNLVRCANLTHASAVLDGFTLKRGRADAGAGVYLRRGGIARNCILTANTSTGDRGAAFTFLTGGFPNPCAIAVDNVVHEGGGAAVLAAGGLLENCLLYGNTAAYGAGALAARGGTLRHCTVVDNTAGVRGGGLVTVDGGVVEACVVHGNQAATDANLWIRGTATVIRHTCATPLPAGSGNLDAIPALSPATLYRPGAGSPLLDRGPLASTPSRDLEGTARPADADGDGLALPDLGCFEYLPSPGAADQDRDGLSEEAEAARGTLPTNPDTDADGVPDGEEVQQATAPLDPSSWLKLLPPLPPSGGGITLRWRSVSNRVYHVHRSLDLTAGFPSPIASGRPATPPLNTHTDASATGSGPYFYRITSDPAP